MQQIGLNGLLQSYGLLRAQSSSHKGSHARSKALSAACNAVYYQVFRQIGTNAIRQAIADKQICLLRRRRTVDLVVGNLTLRLAPTAESILIQQRGFRTKRTTIGSVGGSHFSQKIDEPKTDFFNIFHDSSSKEKTPDADIEKVKKFEADIKKMSDAEVKPFAEGFVKGLLLGGGEEKKKEHSTRWKRLINSLFWAAVLTAIFFALFGGDRQIGSLIFSHPTEVNPEEVHVTFEDVRGMDEAKLEVEEIVSYLRNPERYSRLGGRLPKGVLLVGPPGTGKTLLARAIAGEAQVPFFHTSGSEFDEVLVGQGARRVRDLFEKAKARAPCIIFIDEIDSVGSKRVSNSIHPYANQTINQLLSEMDGFHQNEGIIVIAATNRVEDLDKALLRPGRFDVRVNVPKPDLAGRKDIFDFYLAKIVHSANVDPFILAKGTTGFTGADIENMVNQAALKAATENALEVTMHYLDEAKDRVLMGPARTGGRIPDEEANRNTAYHEAGHTLVSIYTKDATPLHKVTIIPRGTSLGHTAMIPEKDSYQLTKSQILAQLDVMMGGRVAEELIFGEDKVTTGAADDLKKASILATQMVKSFGMSDKVGLRDYTAEESDTALVKVCELSPQTVDAIDREINRVLLESYGRAKDILTKHKNEHKFLAEALLEYETLSAEEVKRIVSGQKLKRPTPAFVRSSNEQSRAASGQRGLPNVPHVHLLDEQTRARQEEAKQI